MRPLAERFWPKVDKNGPIPAHAPHLGRCWVWTASISSTGYGQINCDGRPHRAHRVSWMLAHGAIPDGDGHHGTCVLHRCDTPACVNPAHLFLGTNADNIRDMHSKGRAVHPRPSPEHIAKLIAGQPRGDAHYMRRCPERRLRGEQHGNTTITADDVREIRRLRKEGWRLKAIGARFGLSEPGVSAIARGRTWGHVE